MSDTHASGKQASYPYAGYLASQGKPHVNQASKGKTQVDHASQVKTQANHASKE